MEAIILAGGFGTRLASVVSHVPKVLAPIRGTAFLYLLLNQLARTSLFSKIILALGYKADLVEAALQIAPPFPFAIETVIEQSPLGTGGAILQGLEKVSGDTFWVMNGDTFFDISFAMLQAFHQEKGADLSIACRWMSDRGRYGSLEVDAEGKIIKFREKSSEQAAGLISGGIYLAKKNLFASLPLQKASLEDDFFPLFNQKKIFAYPESGIFIDIGTPASYFEAQTVLTPWIPL